MADLDDIRDGKDFGLDKPAESQGFHLKGCDNMGWGMKDRGAYRPQHRPAG